MSSNWWLNDLYEKFNTAYNNIVSFQKKKIGLGLWFYNLERWIYESLIFLKKVMIFIIGIV